MKKIISFISLAVLMLVMVGCGKTTPKKEKYTVKFITNTDLKIADQIVTKGEKVTKPTDPVKEGYIFDGWYIDDEKWIFSGYIVTSDITLTARFIKKGSEPFTLNNSIKENDIYKVVVSNSINSYDFSLNISIIGYSNYSVSSDEYGSNVYATKQVQLNEGNNYYYILCEKDSGDIDTYKVNIYRKHLYEANKYTITYNANGGEVDIESQIVNFGASYTLPIPTREGWTFIGWYNDSTLYQAGIWNTESDVVLTANWISKPFIENGNQYIYFGEYPQTLKEESVTIISTTPDSNGYYLGSDNERYAKVAAKTNSSTYYFKVEPIKWKILQVNGTQYKLVTDLIIDNQKFHSSTSTRTIDGKTIYPNNYEYSDIRKWLNKDFYNKAFTKELQSIINTTLVDNSAASTKSIYNAYICNDTYDKVYLLSYTDITNEEYGFTNDVSREKQLSDYAKAKGSYMSTSTDYYNNGLYWLRSPDYYNDYRARSVDLDGYIPDSRISDVIIGVSAAITISLE